ncbi:MAG: hypothetical protein J7L15_05725 [Clostridiales bacterium]|nr:hypothetical protein [Clostridiales bacterium]
MKVNTNVLPVGTYIMKTITAQEYTKRHNNSINSKLRGYGRTASQIRESFDSNLKFCDKIFKIERKPIPNVTVAFVGNFTENNSIIPNVLISEIWSKDARDKFPEYFL